MDKAITSDKSSVLLKSLTRAETIDLSYYTNDSYPIGMFNVPSAITPSGQLSYSVGGEVSWNIDKTNLLTDLVIEHLMASVNTNEALTPLGYFMFEWLELRCNNKVILHIAGEYLLPRSFEQKAAECDYTNYMSSQMTDVYAAAVTTTTTRRTFTVLYSSFFEELKMAFDTSFYEQMSLVGKYNTAAKMGIDTAPTNIRPVLWVYNSKLDTAAYDKMKAANISPERPLNMLMYNTDREIYQLTANTGATYKINTTYPLTNIYLMIQPKTNASASLNTRFQSITSVSLKFNGTAVYESVPALIANRYSAKSGCSNGLMVASGAGGPNFASYTRFNNDRIIRIPFAEIIQDKINNTGACSFNQINNPTITLVHADVTTAANFELIIVYEYWNMITFTATNGSVNPTVVN